MSRRPGFGAEVYGSERLEILQNLFASRLSPQTAAEALASESLSDSTLEGGLRKTWGIILIAARELPEHQEELVDLLVCFSGLPPVKDDKGEQLMLYGMRIWDELPTFGREINYEWNAIVVPSEEGPERENVISQFINVNEFAALLMQTYIDVFDFSFWGLVSLRNALEYPIYHLLPSLPLDALLPASAAWIFILGSQIYEWTEEFGRAGEGGPLWDGYRGFCKERWKLWRGRFGEIATLSEQKEEVRPTGEQAELRWRQRLGEIATMSVVTEEVRKTAEQAELRMLEIELNGWPASQVLLSGEEFGSVV